MNAARPLLPLLAAALLAACAPAPPDAPPAAGWEELRALPPDEAWAGVDRHPPERRAGLRLDLLEEWARSERWDALAARLPELDALELGPPAADRRQRLRARLLLRSGEAAAALAALAGLPDDGATAALRIDAYERLGDAQGALRARLARADPDSAAGAAAWERLLATPAARLQDWRDAAADAAWRGWLDLALLSRPGSRPRVTPEETLREWELRYGDGHPARAWLPAALEALRALHPRVRRLAALLPVSGDYAPIGKALRAGIEARMRAQPPDEAPELRIYDTGDPERSVDELYRQAVDEGAERIVGPFRKDAVTRLVRAGGPFAPTVSLNYLRADADAPAALVQFGLLPEDEALQAAERALADGRRAAAVFAPANDWGRRLERAFAARFEAGGGAVRSRAFYFPASSDYAATIKDALRLSAGERRRQAVEEALGREVVAQPARRRDLDMVFLAGTPRSARLFKPQLDFYRAADLPVYATSHVYAGTPSPLQDQDLDGIRFCDLPLVLDERLAAAGDSGPRARRLPRFTALGADAYLLAMNLDYLRLRPRARLEGWTGTLSLQDGGRVFRTLPWAQFRRGRAVPLTGTAAR